MTWLSCRVCGWDGLRDVRLAPVGELQCFDCREWAQDPSAPHLIPWLRSIRIAKGEKLCVRCGGEEDLTTVHDGRCLCILCRSVCRTELMDQNEKLKFGIELAKKVCLP